MLDNVFERGYDNPTFHTCKKKSMNPHSQEAFYGTTTLGEKGQVVIPADARAAMKLKRGEKLLVFSMGHGMLALAKLENLAKFEQHMSKRLAAIRKAVKTTL